MATPPPPQGLGGQRSRPGEQGLNLTLCFSCQQGAATGGHSSQEPTLTGSQWEPHLHTALVSGHFTSNFHQNACTFSLPVFSSVKQAFEQLLCVILPWGTMEFSTQRAPALGAPLSDLFFKPLSVYTLYSHFMDGKTDAQQDSVTDRKGKESRPGVDGGKLLFRSQLACASLLWDLDNLSGCQLTRGHPEPEQGHTVIWSQHRQ